MQKSYSEVGSMAPVNTTPSETCFTVVRWDSVGEVGVVG